ncbi:NAD(P)H-dependent oxidoreductase [Vibrio sp. Of7-15]|uniref:NADPH-dependent FMN reductase n=1 Tax=Vibrio sp. Of7-15 TaxID=2724879 RepID=UPI001EF39C82|nr:NAD(P)H-dependent oxidoreductase [Vibrio sp. Of7-15]MCG7497521.1 NAD(P)H-dependent oxidoreductase [Vibrio sp. Of7-15]
MKVLALAASSSKTSINKQLVTYAANLIGNADVEVLDLNDYEMPIFSEDKEKELGHPEPAKRFFQKIGEADAVLISYAEHNGSYSVAFKNLFDWASRIDMKVYQDKPMVLLATSPGSGGAGSVLAAAKGSAPYFAGDVKAAVSVPSFYDNFDVAEGKLTNAELHSEIEAAIALLR